MRHGANGSLSYLPHHDDQLARKPAISASLLSLYYRITIQRLRRNDHTSGRSVAFLPSKPANNSSRDFSMQRNTQESFSFPSIAYHHARRSSAYRSSFSSSYLPSTSSSSCNTTLPPASYPALTSSFIPSTLLALLRRLSYLVLP
jgi:hypothetical protein